MVVLPIYTKIDTGSDVTLISQNCYPPQYLKDLKKPIKLLVASGQLTQLTKAAFGQFIGIYDASTNDHKIIPLPTVVTQAPSDANYNIPPGIDFLNRFTQFSSDHSTMKLLTPCGHWIAAPIIRNPTPCPNISFRPRSQRGGTTYIHQDKTRKTRVHAPKTLMHSFEVRLEHEVKALLQANFDDNPFKYWDKDKAYADIQLKDANTVVRVKPIRYNQQDELKFKVQLKELEDRQLAFKSSEENKSPHSSLAFMVNNHSEQKRGKPRMVINYNASMK